MVPTIDILSVQQPVESFADKFFGVRSLVSRIFGLIALRQGETFFEFFQSFLENAAFKSFDDLGCVGAGIDIRQRSHSREEQSQLAICTGDVSELADGFDLFVQ